MIHTLLPIVLGVTVALSKRYGPGPVSGLVPPADTTRRSSDWLSLLPDGEEKRRFILDCTGCHQIDDQVARPGGRPRTPAEFGERVTQMLSFAGSTTGFPVIGHSREAASTASWLARYLIATPTIRPRHAAGERAHHRVCDARGWRSTARRRGRR